MINENNKINTDELKVISNAIPRLQAGKYVLHTKQKVALKGSESQTFENKETTFEVAAPRFSLEPAVIYSEYPAKDSKGSFSNTLPNVVFKRKTLLWERIISVDADKTSPWMALLLFEEDELKENNITMQSIVMQDIFKKDNTIITPEIDPEESDKIEIKKYKDKINEAPKYSIIDVPATLLNDIIPYESELKYLAHARQVDTSDKEKQESNAKGWYSVLIGNRLPTLNKKHVGFAVSLEGHKAILDGKKLLEPNNVNRRVRLIVLHAWEFTCQGEDFQMLVENIDKAADVLKMDVNESEIDDSVKKAFNYGYTAINHQMRNGASNISWYRGPLVPVQISITDPGKLHFEDADAALLFDEDTAMFDISYSSAWQIGRLIGLQAPAYSNTLNNWKKNFKRDRQLKVAKKLLKDEFKDSVEFEEGKEQTKKLLFSEAVNNSETDDFLNSLLSELWVKKIKNNG